MAQKAKFQSLKNILSHYDLDQNKYVSREFQEYGCRIAEELGDTKHISLYIKLAKVEDRFLLEEALAFTKDARNARSKGRLFMWKLKELRKERNTKEKTAGDK